MERWGDPERLPDSGGFGAQYQFTIQESEDEELTADLEKMHVEEVLGSGEFLPKQNKKYSQLHCKDEKLERICSGVRDSDEED